ncbi:hypothetical protein PRO82_000825 [Candidatus Protochlamydia amoebophila]|nr:hypothetical protein [Candidatus Protochlamydia amoebophila]
MRYLKNLLHFNLKRVSLITKKSFLLNGGLQSKYENKENSKNLLNMFFFAIFRWFKLK